MFSSNLLRLLLLISTITVYSAAYKVLVFSPSISRSHLISNGRVADALASDGHNVTLLELEYLVPIGALNVTQFANLWQIKGQFLDPSSAINFIKWVANNAFEQPSLVGIFFGSKTMQTALNSACETLIKTQSFQLEQLRKQKFDVIISEQLNFCGVGIGHLLGIPVNILLSSSSIQEHVASLIGLPFPSSFVPSLMDSDLSDKMSLSQRFKNLLHTFVGNNYLRYGIDPLTEIFRKHFGSAFPDLRSIVGQSPLIFVASDEFVDFPQPIFSNVIHIGGLGMKKSQDAKAKSLKDPFLSEMGKGADGVVFFSMGSIMRSSDMPESVRRHIFEAFGQLKNYHFIVKVEKDDKLSANLAKHLDNVFLTSWAPQLDILGNPRLRLFVTHGGYNSLLEAANAGVPVLLMGFFADQHRNGRVAERNGWGRVVEKRLLLEGSEHFRAAIQTMLEDQSYGANAKRTQRLLATKPFTAKERLLKNIRFLELNGGQLPELLSESRHMSWVQLYNFDLALLAALSALTFLIGLRYLAKFAFTSAILIKNVIFKKSKDKKE